MRRRFFRRWLLILSPALWKRRPIFWAGGIAVAVVRAGRTARPDAARIGE